MVMMATLIIALVALVFILTSEEGGWPYGFFSGFLTVAVIVTPYYIYSYFREKKKEDQSS